ncbi:uncharacterized protein LOC142526458 [Primulina tabacum]|uniref:uncharacterized protein LOC142526458 n=1 Tax=Primulina tabacum TaxID=48773 RepID=UPI003F5A8DD6
MRSVNMVKSWPFDDFATEQTVDSFLPPIMVKKFSWWLDELEYSRSVMAVNVGNSKKKKKRVEGKGETSLRGVEDVEESDMDVEEGLGVAKAPKKRSIVDIFAASPLSVERMINLGEEEDNYDPELDGFSVNSKWWGLQGKRNEKSKEKKINKETTMSKLKNSKKSRDNFKNKKRRGDNKEKRLKLKSLTQDVANVYGIRDRVSSHKRKSSPQNFDAEKKIMAHEANKLMSENQHQILPVRGILKNHAKVISVQNSAKSILQESIQLSGRGKQKENKHVTFSEKDDIIKLARKSLLSVECLKVPILNGSDMDAVAASFCEDDVQEIEKDTTLGETSDNEELSNEIPQEINTGYSWKEPSTFHRCSINTTDYLKQHKMDEFFSGSVTSYQDTLHDLKKFESGLKDAPQIPMHAYSPGFFCMPLECCCRAQNIKMVCDPSNSNCGSLFEDLRSAGSRFHPMCLKDYLDACKRPSVPCMYNGGRISNTPLVSSQSKMDNLFPHPYPYQTLPNLSPTEYMHSLCSSTNGNQRGYLCEKRNIYGLTESSLGLPLTLQRELIKLNSSADWDFCQMKSSMTADPSPSLSTRSNVMSKSLGNHSDCRNWDCRTSVDQLNLCPFEDNLKAKPLVVPSNLDFSKFQSNGKGNRDLGLIKLRSFQPDKSISNQKNQIQKFPGNERVLSTVRLMGKEFIVGGRLGEFRDALNCSSEMKFTSENMHSHPQFHGQTTMHKNNFPVQTLYSAVSPDASFTVNRSKPVFPEALTSQYESHIFSFELPTSTPVLQESHPILISRANELVNNQNWLHTPKSAIRFPFVHSDIEGEVLSSQTRSCSLNPHPLFVDVLDEGRLFRYRHSNCTFANDRHSLAMLGTTLLD